jgi:hypothetical protein
MPAEGLSDLGLLPGSVDEVDANPLNGPPGHTEGMQLIRPLQDQRPRLLDWPNAVGRCGRT